MKHLSSLLLCILCLLLDTGRAAAKICDEVLYIAWDAGQSIQLDLLTAKWNYEVLRFPHYIGAVCIDNVNKALHFSPIDADFPFNYEANDIIEKINSQEDIHVFAKDWQTLQRYKMMDERGEGEGLGYWPLRRSSIPKSSRFFPYWVWEVLEYKGFQVIRRTFKVEPDMAWRPNFVKTLLWHEVYQKIWVEHDWTEQPEQNPAPCDEVWYLAWNRKELDRKNWWHDGGLFSIDAFPVYIGALCVDKENRWLSFYPKAVDSPLNSLAEAVIMNINGAQRAKILSDKKRRFLLDVVGTLGWRELFTIRRTYNAAPDMLWKPKPIKTMLQNQDEPRVPLDFEWTE